MIYNYSELLKKKSRKEIETLVLNKKLYKLETGIYSDTLVGDDLVVYSKKYKSSIVTMESAFYYYDLTDVVPTVTTLATLSNARKIKNKNVKQYYVPKGRFESGKVLERVKDGSFYIYDKERLLVELVSKDENKLLKVSESIKRSRVYVCDLTYDSEVKKLCEYILREKFEVVINCAGFGAFGFYDEVSLDREMDMVKVNVTSLHKITKTCLKYMEECKEAYILNVASIAGLLPGGPLLNTYYATKSYVRSYTLGIYEELRRKKSRVNVSCLCPGPVKTNFNNVAGGHFSIRSKTPEYVSKYAIDMMFKKKLVILPGLDVKLGSFFGRVLPSKLVLRVLYKVEHKKRG